MNTFAVRKSGSAAAAILCTALLASAGANATAASPGSIVVKGKTSTLTSAYAYHHPAPYDAKVMQTTVVLSDKAIDVKKVEAAGGDFDKALHASLDEAKAAYWEAIFYPDGTLWSGTVVSPGVLLYGGTGCDVQMTRNDAKRVEGACHTADETQKDNHEDGVYVDVKFALDL